MRIGDLYVAPNGNDRWSGKLAEPNTDRNDGPLASLTEARNRVRSQKQTGMLAGPLTVWLRGGRYSLAAPLTFSPEDSGPITYATYPGEQPIIDGGQRITGWRIEQYGTTSRWVVDLPDVAAGRWSFRQLFVDGERRPRTRLPKSEFFTIADVPGMGVNATLFEGSTTFQCFSGDIQAWHNLSDVEIVVPHYWVAERMPIVGFDTETNLVQSTHTSVFCLKDDFARRYARYYVENVFEALTEPGEWYLDRPAGQLYYMPLPGEDPATTEVIAPRLTQLLRLVGDPDAERFVEFLRFQGLTFAHTDWLRPPGGHPRAIHLDMPPDTLYATSAQGACTVPGTVYLEGARYCVIERCKVAHVGGYAVELSNGCVGNRVVGNELFDLGAGGVRLDGAHVTEPMARRTGNNQVTDNHIHVGGRVFPDATGILAMHTFGNHLSHNHIHDLFYSGISCGWIWGYGDNIAKDNRIEHNHIHQLGQKMLSDMGGIYMLGVQPGTIIRGNLIHDVEQQNYGGWGIYLDEGSSHMVIEHNICYNLGSQGFNQHYGRENIVRNNIFAFGTKGQVSLGRDESHTAFTLERNLLISAASSFFVAGYGVEAAKPHFISDLNLFWDIHVQSLHSRSEQHDMAGRWSLDNVQGLDAWQSLGNDRHSIVADPRFRSLAHFDFALEVDSPAWAIGFVPIDMSNVGPRPLDQQTT